MSAISSGPISRTGLAGTPMTSQPAFTTLPGGTSAPAPTWAPSSTMAPVRTTAPMPMRTSLPIVHAWTTQRWPMVTLSPTMHGKSGVVQDRVVLDVGVATDLHVIVLVAAHDGEGPDRRALVDLHVADHLRRDVDVGARMDARRAARDRADHRAVSGSSARLMARLAAATVGAGALAMSRAHAVASSISRSGATTEESRPSRYASSASTVRPVRSMSRARPSGNSRESWTLDAMSPTFTPTAPSLARVEPTRTSHQSASTRPPPIAQPLMAPMTGTS